MTTKDRHVVANTSGGWSVRQSGASRATRSFDTQAAAVKFAREIAKQERTGLYVHRRDGTIQQKDSYVDNHPPHKGKRG
jgi:hypothetical protein